MSRGLEIIIHAEGYSLCHDKNPLGMEYIGNREIDLGARVAEYCMTNKLTVAKVTLYIDDELLFLKSFTLPLATPAIKEAVKFQLDMMVPFPANEMAYSFSINRGKENYNISLFAAQNQSLGNCVQELISAGYMLTGLFPENQRYVTTQHRRKRWVLVMPCQFTKIYVFSGCYLEDRFLSNTELDYQELSEICQTQEIYHLAAPGGTEYKNADDLLNGTPALKEHNMMPETYRRPDYLKYVIMVLVAINIAGLIALGGSKAYHLSARAKQVDEEIEKIMPQVREVRKLKLKKNEIEGHLDALKDIGKNPDLILYLEQLTTLLPESSYLDQMRFDEKNMVITIQGYTENVGELTKALQDLGEARLKSTSRRRNKTYFQVEISVP